MPRLLLRYLAMRRLSPLLILLACTRADDQARDSAHPAAAATRNEPPCGPTARARDTLVQSVPVNRGTHGMTSRVRWALSPDRCSILVVEDPAAVEAEPVPNGFLLASERGPAIVQRDSVWDVAPSPDWSRVVYGRAWGIQGGGRDSVTTAEWEAPGGWDSTWARCGVARS